MFTFNIYLKSVTVEIEIFAMSVKDEQTFHHLKYRTEMFAVYFCISCMVSDHFSILSYNEICNLGRV